MVLLCAGFKESRRDIQGEGYKEGYKLYIYIYIYPKLIVLFLFSFLNVLNLY